MDDAAAEAGREEILPRDLLQGIAPASYVDLSDRTGDPTRRTLSNYFRARNFPGVAKPTPGRFTVHPMPETSESRVSLSLSFFLSRSLSPLLPHSAFLLSFPG